MQVEEAERVLQENEQAIKTLSPGSDVRRINFEWIDATGEKHKVSYIQAKMGMFHAQEFITMMTRLIKDVLDGKYDVDVMELLRDRDRLKSVAIPSEVNEDAVDEMVKEWMPFIQGFLKLTDIVPGLQKDIIALSLGVRDEDRVSFKKMISQAPYLGGLEIDDAVDIIKVFIKQNAKVLRRFLGRQVREVVEELMEALADDQKKEQSTDGGTPSSTSPQPIPESA